MLRDERKRWGGSLNSFRLELAAICDDDLFRSLSAAASKLFEFLDDIHALNDTSENDMVSVEPVRLCRADEKLRAIRVWVRH